MTANTTIRGERSKQAILRAGLCLWREGGEKAVTARGVAAKVGMTHTGCIWHWGTVTALRSAVAEEAVRLGDVPVVRQLIVAGHPAVSGMSPETRQAYLAGV